MRLSHIALNTSVLLSNLFVIEASDRCDLVPLFGIIEGSKRRGNGA